MSFLIFLHRKLARVKRSALRVASVFLRLGRFWFGGSGILGGGREVVDVVQADVAHTSCGFAGLTFSRSLITDTVRESWRVFDSWVQTTVGYGSSLMTLTCN